MIYFTHPSPKQHRAMASAAIHAAAATESVLKDIKEGFLSCVTKVYNSLTTMKETAVGSLYRLTNRLRPSATEVSPSLPVKTSVDPISAADTRFFCHIVKRKMAENPDYINTMFRVATKVKPDEFNVQLKDQRSFLAAIDQENINRVDVSFLVKQWMGQTLAGNRFTIAERKKLVENKDKKDEVIKIFNGKFDHSNAIALENRDKLISLLSVMNKYKELSETSDKSERAEHHPDVIGVVGIAQLFDFDETLFTNISPVGKAMRTCEINEVLTAFTALLNHRYPAVPPRSSIAKLN